MTIFIIFMLGFVMIPAIVQTIRAEKFVQYISDKYGIEKEKIKFYFNKDVDDLKKQNKEFEEDITILKQESLRMATSAMFRGLIIIFLFIIVDYLKIF